MAKRRKSLERILRHSLTSHGRGILRHGLHTPSKRQQGHKLEKRHGMGREGVAPPRLWRHQSHPRQPRQQGRGNNQRRLLLLHHTSQPPPPTSDEDNCDVSYRFLYDIVEVRGKGFPDAKLGRNGEGLRHQLQGCGALTDWHFEMTPHDVKYQWYASGKLPIGTRSCAGKRR